MSEYRPPLTDLDFLLNHMCVLEGVSKLEGYEAADPATVQALLDEGGKFMAEVIAPLNKLGDVEGARWEDYQVTLPDGWREAYKMTTEAGWNTMGFPAEYGGGNFPFLVETALSELIGSANMSFSMAFGLTTGAIEALAAPPCTTVIGWRRTPWRDRPVATTVTRISSPSASS